MSYDAVVIGAGFSGIYALHRLREIGLSVHGIEVGGDVGGTWYWNRYPGARCDAEWMYYSYSFLPEVDRDWPMTERYPPQPELLRYLEHVATVLDVRRDFTFGARVESVVYDESSERWTLRTDDGQELSATYVVAATGCLSAPTDPGFDGVERYSGETYWTSRWPHEPVSFAGKRVGIIGTGSTGIQATPVIAADAEHLTVFQRTPQFTIPARNEILDEQLVEMWKANYPEWRRRGRLSLTGVPYPISAIAAADLSPEEREARFEAAWERGGLAFTYDTFNDLVVSEEANEAAADFVRRKIEEIVDDPEVAETLKPRDYPFATKRLPMDTDYYETFNRPNVRLVDLRATPIDAFDATGIRTTAELHELDAIVFATGFDALTGPLLRLGIQGRGGQPLADRWATGPRTYLGLAVPGFPNLFTITGPGSPSVLSNMPVPIEHHVEWIAECIEHMRANGISSIEATEEATEAWTEHVQEAAAETLYPRAASWYMGANVPGKPRLFLPYVGGVGIYREKIEAIAADGYRGFAMLTGAATKVNA